MLKGKALWYVLMATSLGGWVFTVTGLVKPFENQTLKKAWRGVLFAWVGGHPLELMLALRIGRQAGLSPVRTVVKTLAFGFTWWVPVWIGVLKR